MESVKNLNTIKNEYLNPTPDRIVDKKVLELVSDFVIPKLTGERILELGVGDQVWTIKLTERFPYVTSVDGSSALLEAMRKKLTDKPFKNHWCPVTCFFEEYRPKKRFDTVLATYILEHVDDPSLILRLARENWLKKSGKLAVVVPHALSLHRRLAVKMGLASYPGELGDTDHRMGHKRCLTCYEMEKMIIDANFRIIEKRGMFTKLLPNSALINCSDDQLRGMFNLGIELPIEYSGCIFFLAEAIS